MRRMRNWLGVVTVFLMISGCGGDGDGGSEPDPITLIAATVNGGILVNGASNVSVDGQLELVFSSALDAGKFETAFDLNGGGSDPSYQITYANASSKAVISYSGLEFNTEYTLNISAGAIASNGQTLTSNIQYAFTTIEDGTVREMTPCTSASQDCYRTVSIEDDSQITGNFGFYGNYPIYLENAEWEKLKYALIVIHGANRDADNYYTYLSSTLSSEQLQESTILIAPEFKESGDSNDLTWNSNWREGQNSTGSAQVSSFAAIDALITRLSDQTAFPVLEKVIITGHSSGGLFTQVYGAANTVDVEAQSFELEYMVANSQYFYYPDNQRYNEQTNQFYLPDGCAAYNRWPLGYTAAPAYVNSRSESEIDANLLGRSFTYFLGNGSGADPSLNTNDCEATLLGSTRFKRGEHIFEWIDTEYSGQNNSQKVVVDGIGHDGQAMYQSNDFKSLLSSFFE